MNLKKYLKKNFLIGSLKTIIVTLSTLILLPLIINKIGLEKYGIISILTIISGGAFLFEIGISKAVIVLSKEIKQEILFFNALFLYLIIILGLFILFCFIYYFNINIFGKNFIIDDFTKKEILIVGFLLVIFIFMSNLLNALLEIKLLAHYINFYFIISSIGLLGYIYILANFTSNIHILILSPLLSTITSFLFLVFIYFKKIKIHFIIFLDKEVLIKIFKTSLNFFKLSFINSIFIPLNKYLILYMSGNSIYLGSFDIGLKIAMIANSFLNSISLPLLGYFVKVKSNIQIKMRQILKIVMLLFILYISGVIIYYFIGNYIVTLLQLKYVSVYHVSLLLIIGICSGTIVEPIYRFFISESLFNEIIKAKIILLFSAMISILVFSYIIDNAIYIIAFSIIIGFLVYDIFLFRKFFLYKERFFK